MTDMNDIWVGRFVTLEGVSNHGKNRVAHQGPFWTVVGWVTSLQTSKHKSLTGPFILLRSADDKNTRWVSIKDDPDFIIIVNDD